MEYTRGKASGNSECHQIQERRVGSQNTARTVLKKVDLKRTNAKEEKQIFLESCSESLKWLQSSLESHQDRPTVKMEWNLFKKKKKKNLSAIKRFREHSLRLVRAVNQHGAKKQLSLIVPEDRGNIRVETFSHLLFVPIVLYCLLFLKFTIYSFLFRSSLTEFFITYYANSITFFVSCSHSKKKKV